MIAVAGLRSEPRDMPGALERLTAALARLEGRRDALASRHDALEREIAVAKGRLAIRDEVEAFVEDVQAQASRRNLASFEALLSALVQEVLPGEKPVSLELTTERGLAALDICVARPDGTREDVLEDNGGALTNVIGAALRLIAVVKAGAGRFLALDEGDCWIAPERVPAFFRVIEDSAARLGVQCLAISHHDVSAFGRRFRVSRVVGEAEGGVKVACPDPEAWPLDAPGFRHVRLIDVQAFADATLTLGPGVNALVGPNNRGKSTFVRALRAVFYGEARDSLVRAGARTAAVEIGVAHGRTLRFVRRPQRTPVNLWSLHEADGSVAEEGGTRLETGGRSVPDWVERLFGIVKVESLDVHIAHQKFPVFLLGEPASRRSAVLSIGQEAAYVRDMLAIHREACARDAALVRNGERELAGIREELDALEGIPAIADEVAVIRTRAAGIEASRIRLDALVARAGALDKAHQQLRGARIRADALRGLPEADAFEAAVAQVERSRRRDETGRRLLDASRLIDAARRRLDALSGLPAAPPALADMGAARRALDGLTALGISLSAARRGAAGASEELEKVKREARAIVDGFKGLCPTCGAPLQAARTLEDHAHAGWVEAAA